MSFAPVRRFSGSIETWRTSFESGGDGNFFLLLSSNARVVFARTNTVATVRTLQQLDCGGRDGYSGNHPAGRKRDRRHPPDPGGDREGRGRAAGTHRPDADRAALRRAHPDRGAARAGQDHGRQDAGGHHPHLFPADPVHAGPAPRGHPRHPDLPAGHRHVRDQEGPDLPQHHPRRRDQPRPRQGPERPARGDAGAPGDHRPADVRARQAVSRPGHAEPDRARGHLPAPRGADRPLHDEDQGRLPLRGRGKEDHGAGLRGGRRPGGRRGRVRAGRRGEPDHAA